MLRFAQQHNASLKLNLIGWFAIAFSNELKFGQTKKGMLFNKCVTLFRTLHGELMFNGSNENIVEKNNIIYVWHHPSGSYPTWQIPALNHQGWSPFLNHELIVQSHPQEIYENSIDIAHFSIVHGFSQVCLLQEPCFDGHCMSVAYSLKRKKKRIVGGAHRITAEFDMKLYGLGCAHTHIYVPSRSMHVRMLTLATPTQDGQVNVRLAIAIGLSTGNLIKKITFPFIHRLIQKNIIADFCQDVPVWEHKKYFPTPLLVKGDGQIIKFRRWCGQFYKES